MSAITYTVIVFISCVGHRFVFGVTAASRNTRFQAARYGLTWVGLAPTDRASFAWRLPSLDHLVGEGEQLVGNLEAERLGSHDTDDQLVLGRLFDRQVAWLCASENGRHVMRPGAAIGIGVACAIAYQTAGQNKLTNAADRRHTMSRGERRHLPAPVVEQGAGTDKQCADARLNDGRKC